jgi:hypothetical protein
VRSFLPTLLLLLLLLWTAESPTLPQVLR